MVSVLIPCEQEIRRGKETLQPHSRGNVSLSLVPAGAGAETWWSSSTGTRNSYTLVFTGRSSLCSGAGWIQFDNM